MEDAEMVCLFALTIDLIHSPLDNKKLGGEVRRLLLLLLLREPGQPSTSIQCVID